MVSGIKNSISEALNEMMLKIASASVVEWPMVKAVTSIKIFFQSRTT